VNFYKHHLGDYDGHTAHLSWDEDMAYTRLLRAYYRREEPIPPSEAYRLARASSKAQRAAVDSVLREFFAQGEGGWRNKRADEEIAAYLAQAETNRRIARERTVQRSVHVASTKRLPSHKPDTRSHKPEESKSTPVASGDGSPSAGNGTGVAYIPLNDGSEHPISQADADELGKLYPALDVLQTLREIRGWNIANPTRRKTKSGVMRHVNSWFSKEQNKAP